MGRVFNKNITNSVVTENDPFYLLPDLKILFNCDLLRKQTINSRKRETIDGNVVLASAHAQLWFSTRISISFWKFSRQM
ncbi:unnamed protein product [Larinioides sclopetarius]|uniref:Uncharacterized protein n=1 Tax=Larinioides sclopetarius TaxID=280406 RepID=A0AAV1Z9F6_9ARAC